jgi:hypothetical protein
MAARRNEQRHILWQTLDGSAPPESLIAGRNDRWPGGWTRDGRLVFVESPPTEITDIMLLWPGAAPPRVEPLVAGPTEDVWPALSPNGDWIAYTVLDRGTYQVYVRPFQGGAPTQISTDGGSQPRWSRDGLDVFYRGRGRFLRVPIRTSPELVIGKPEVLFDDTYHATDAGPPNYDVSPDGRRFLMIKPGDTERADQPLHIVLNWFEELRRRVTVAR